MHSFAGSSTQIRHISLRSLLPNTDQFMTYEGSTTHPGCWESTVWIILNKPIYITKQEVRKKERLRLNLENINTQFTAYVCVCVCIYLHIYSLLQ